MKFNLHSLMVCAVLTACGGGGGGGTDTSLPATTPQTSGSSIISNSGGVVGISGNTVVELSAGVSTLPATVTALIRPTTAGGLSDEVVVDLSATEPAEADVNEVTVYIYPASVQQAAPIASQKAAATGLTSSDAVAANKPLETFKFANSTVPYTLDQLNVVGTTGENIKLVASRLLFDPAKGAIKATFKTASAAVSTVKALKNKAATFVVNVIATNNDNTTRLFHFPTLSSDGNEINTLATAQTKIPLVLVHGIQLGTEGCGRNSGYKSTWAKFRTNFFNDVDTASKYDLYSFSYPTNLDFKTNGAALSQKLSAAFGNKPVVVVAHSMGGLVTRAADVYYSTKAQSGNATDINIARVITLDTPHRGTPYVNEAATLSEVLCIGPAASAGAPSLAWDDLDTNGSCTNSRNPTLCELNRPQNLQHLKKYVPYSAYSVLGTATSYAGSNVHEFPLLLQNLTSSTILLAASFTQGVIDNYFSSEVAKKSDIAVLVPSQRFMSQVNNQWVDNPNVFADLPDTYSSTLHIDLLGVSLLNPGVAGSEKVWSKKADGTPGGIRAHLLVFETQLAGKPDLVPSAITVSLASVQPGGSVNVSWRTTNSGNGNAAASTTGIRLLSATTSGNGTAANNLVNVHTGALAAGGVANQSQVITIPAGTVPGSYVVVVAVDNVATSTLGQSNIANDFARSNAFSIISTPSTTTVTSSFTDNFDGVLLQPNIWTTVNGTIAVANGAVSFGCSSSASTAGKLNFAGGRIVVEAGFIGLGQIYSVQNNLFGKVLRDTAITLTDTISGNRIIAGDTNYFDGGGLYLIGTGMFNIPQFGNGISSNTYMEYRLTINGNAVKLERGTSLSNITATINAVLPSSALGKSFYLTIGTGGPDYCPSEFNWVSVKTFP